MTPPSSVVRGAEAALEHRLGTPVRITGWTPVGGGCINPSARLTTDRREDLFLKWNAVAPREMFDAEADGLVALARAGSLRTPEVLGTGGAGTAEDPGWLLLEYVPKGRPASDYGQRMGEGLASLHAFPERAAAAEPPPMFGWHRDNFIGSLPQENGRSPDWVTFWAENRLEPQLRAARAQGYFTDASGRVMEDLLANLPVLMAGTEADGPALLHGDLWSGNYYPGPSGEPVVIDPAVYRGVGEVDLAMMELFGSLPRGFLEGYGGSRTLHQEYGAFRRDLYQLFYLLVHVNLFGGGYVAGALAAAKRALRGI